MRSWHIIGILSFCLFLLLAGAVSAVPEVLVLIDAKVSALIAPLQTLFGIQAFLVITALGGGVGIIAVAVGFVFIARLSSGNALRLTMLLTVVAVSSKLLKEFFERTRPDPLTWFDVLASASFPSAHAAIAVALYGFIAVYAYRRTQSLVLVLIPLLIILLVGVSRIVLGAHYFSDVLGGYALGTLMLALLFLIPNKGFLKKYG